MEFGMNSVARSVSIVTDHLISVIFCLANYIRYFILRTPCFIMSSVIAIKAADISVYIHKISAAFLKIHQFMPFHNGFILY